MGSRVNIILRTRRSAEQGGKGGHAGHGGTAGGIKNSETSTRWEGGGFRDLEASAPGIEGILILVKA